MKVCKGCLISKQEKEFYYCKNTKDKLMSKCISCNKLYMTKYYKKNTQINVRKFFSMLLEDI